jgi:hypothetical protein
MMPETSTATGLSPRKLELLETFGYVVLSSARLRDLGLESDALMSEVRATVQRVYPDAPSSTKLMLPMMAESTPVSTCWALDGALPRIAADLLREYPVVKPAKLTRFPMPTMWHRDTYLPIAGYKMGLYVEEATVTFDVVVGSHHGAVQTWLDGELGATAKRPSPKDRNPSRALPDDVPATQVLLPKGSLLLFDLGLWHANLSAQGRLQWSVSYLRPAVDERQVDDLAAYLAEFAEYAGTYPRDVYPYFPRSWMDGSSTSTLYGQARPVLDRIRANGGVE